MLEDQLFMAEPPVVAVVLEQHSLLEELVAPDLEQLEVQLGQLLVELEETDLLVQPQLVVLVVAEAEELTLLLEDEVEMVVLVVAVVAVVEQELPALEVEMVAAAKFVFTPSDSHD